MKLTLPSDKFRSLILIFGTLTFFVYYFTHAGGQVYFYLSSFATLISLLLADFALYSLIKTFGKGPLSDGFRLIFVGISCSVIGQIFWMYYTIINPSKLVNTIPNYLFLTTYLINFLGYLKIAVTLKTIIKEFLAMIVSFLILGVIFITLAQASNPLTFNLIGIGFLSGDIFRFIIIALILQLVIIYQGGMVSRYWLSIFVGNIFIFIGNFSAAILSKGYYSGTWPYTLIDLIFIGGYLYVANGFYGIKDSIKFIHNKITQHKRDLS